MEGMEKFAVIAIAIDIALIGGCAWGGTKLYRHFNPASEPSPATVMQMKDSAERDRAIDNILRVNGVPAGQEPLVREVILHDGGNCGLLNQSLEKPCETSKRTLDIK